MGSTHTLLMSVSSAFGLSGKWNGKESIYPILCDSGGAICVFVLLVECAGLFPCSLGLVHEDYERCVERGGR